MPKTNDTLRRPVIDGVELVTVEELSVASGLSVLYLRECTRANSRGRRIPAYKIGIRLWFKLAEAMSAIYAGTKRNADPVPQQATSGGIANTVLAASQQTDDEDMSWL